MLWGLRGSLQGLTKKGLCGSLSGLHRTSINVAQLKVRWESPEGVWDGLKPPHVELSEFGGRYYKECHLVWGIQQGSLTSRNLEYGLDFAGLL